MHRDDVHSRGRGRSSLRGAARHVLGVCVYTILIVAAGCSKPDAEPKVAAGAAVAPSVASAGTPCSATGNWAECSVIYRLDRAGLGPRIDSTDKAEESALHGASFVVKIGQIAKLEVFLYPDSTARIADGLKLDRTKFVDGTAPQTIRREKTLIENGNLIGLLTSLNERQRERVSDALTAGAPQPNSSTP